MNFVTKMAVYQPRGAAVAKLLVTVMQDDICEELLDRHKRGRMKEWIRRSSLRTGSRLGLGRDSRVGAGRAESGLVRRECASHSFRSRIHALTPTRFAARFTLRSSNFFPPSQGACSQATEERRERDVSMHIKLPLSLPGFLDFFAFLTFSLSASLSPQYSSKLLLCCSSQDDGNAVAILY